MTSVHTLSFKAGPLSDFTPHSREYWQNHVPLPSIQTAFLSSELIVIQYTVPSFLKARKSWRGFAHFYWEVALNINKDSIPQSNPSLIQTLDMLNKEHFTYI